jgi:aryl-alcohol dehydrogenase-like predicted oxidoreductase
MEEQCPKFKDQKFYCSKCLAEFKYHPHQAMNLSDLSQEVNEKWSELNTKYVKIYEAVRMQFKPMKPLVELLD